MSIRNWPAVKEVLLEGLSGDMKEYCGAIFENTKHELEKNGVKTSNEPRLGLSLVLPILRRIIGEMGIYNIVGVQALDHNDEDQFIEVEEDGMMVKTYIVPQRYRSEIFWNVKEYKNTDFDAEAEDMLKKALDLHGFIEQKILSRIKESFDYSNYTRYVPSDECLSDFIETEFDSLYSDDDDVGKEFIILSQRALEYLQEEDYEFTLADKVDMCHSYTSPLEKIGTLEGADVYYDEYASNDIMIGYKMSDANAPLIYAPYVPIEMEQVPAIIPGMARYEFLTNHALYADDVKIRKHIAYFKFEEISDDDGEDF